MFTQAIANRLYRHQEPAPIPAAPTHGKARWGSCGGPWPGSPRPPSPKKFWPAYFVDCRKELLVAWLDRVSASNTRKASSRTNAPSPRPRQNSAEHVKAFLAEADDPDRGLLLSAFGAQSAIDWPNLDGLISAENGSPVEAAKA